MPKKNTKFNLFYKFFMEFDHYLQLIFLFFKQIQIKLDKIRLIWQFYHFYFYLNEFNMII